MTLVMLDASKGDKERDILESAQALGDAIDQRAVQEALEQAAARDEQEHTLMGGIKGLRHLEFHAEDYGIEMLSPEELGHLRRVVSRLEAANRDTLTGLLNRSYIDEGLKRLVEKCDRAEVPISCTFVDLDKFKSINDQYAHIFHFMYTELDQWMVRPQGLTQCPHAPTVLVHAPHCLPCTLFTACLCCRSATAANTPTIRPVAT